MRISTLPSMRWCLPLLVLALLLSHLALLASASRSAAPTEEEEDADTESGNAFCSVAFANSYFATIATTMPIADHAPLAQTGHLYVDHSAGAIRIDQFFRNHRTTLLLDNHRLRGFLFFGERDFQPTATAATSSQQEEEEEADAAGGEEDVVRHRCHVFYLPRKVAPFCVPRGYAVETHPSVIRGVPVSVFTGMERYPDMPLVEQSFYVLNSSAALRDADSSPRSFHPWRLEYRARPDLEPPKIASAPSPLPNWRFFGHPMFDELALSSAATAQLQRWHPSVDLMTIDFFDYYPTSHAENIFAVPPQCTAVLRRDAAHGEAGTTTTMDSEESAPTPGEDGLLPRLQLATLQRFMLQWHRLQNASCQAG